MTNENSQQGSHWLVAALLLVLVAATPFLGRAAAPAGLTTVGLSGGIYDLNGTLAFTVSVEDRAGNPMSFDMSADIVHDERGRLTSDNATLTHFFYNPVGALSGTLHCTGRGSLRGLRRPGVNWTRVRGVFRCTGTLNDGLVDHDTRATLVLDNHYDAIANTTRENTRIAGRIGTLVRGALVDRDVILGPPAYLPAPSHPVLQLMNVTVGPRGRRLTTDTETDVVGLGAQTYTGTARGAYNSRSDTSVLVVRGDGGSRVVLRKLTTAGGSATGGDFILRMLGFTVIGPIP